LVGWRFEDLSEPLTQIQPQEAPKIGTGLKSTLPKRNRENNLILLGFSNPRVWSSTDRLRPVGRHRRSWLESTKPGLHD
jgi:hypothetical protein